MNLFPGVHIHDLFNNSLDELRFVLQRFVFERLMSVIMKTPSSTERI